VELANPGQKLKPAMFAQVEVTVGGKAPVLTVPDSAVIDTGARRMVLVQVQEGRFEPRDVELGARGVDFVEIVKGVSDGEQVVVAANFLIDAESNLKAAISGMGAAPAAPAAATAPGPATVGHKAEGRVDSIDLQAGTVSLNHGPVASLKWPAMTMEFKAANAALLAGLKPGQAVSFEFVERQPGEYVVTAITAPRGGAAPSPVKPAPAVPTTKPGTHTGH
jgi:Cu(I)/Ag(I) efflux system membrane fusion protein